MNTPVIITSLNSANTVSNLFNGNLAILCILFGLHVAALITIICMYIRDNE